MITVSHKASFPQSHNVHKDFFVFFVVLWENLLQIFFAFFVALWENLLSSFLNDHI